MYGKPMAFNGKKKHHIPSPDGSFILGFPHVFFFYIVICDVIFRLINGTPSSSKLGVQYSWVDIYGLNIGLLEKNRNITS